MDMSILAESFKNLCTVQGFVFVVLGSLAGVLLGAIPGLGSSTLLVVLLPLAYKMEPAMCMALFISVVIGGMSGGCIGSILLGIPGTSSSLCTVWDGYEFTKQGNPVRALSAAVTANFLGTVPSLILAIFAVKYLARWAVTLGPWEYAGLCFMAVLMVVGLSKGNVVKSMIGVGLAIFLSSIGTDPINATGRFVLFGNLNFLKGLNLISVMLGLFAAKIIMLEYARHEKQNNQITVKVDGYKIPLKDFIENKWCFIRSWLTGVVIGFLPGLGGPVAAVMAYSNEKTLDKKNKEKWGHGNIAGVISCETANNAGIGGALIPLIALGIPGDAACVQFISALNVKGIQVGPLLIQEHPEIVYMIFIGAILSGIVVLLYETLGMKTFPSLLKIPYHYLYSMVIILALTGAYMSTNNLFGLYVALGSCILGVIMDVLEIPSLPFLMTFILSPMLEENLRKGFSYAENGWVQFFTRPISLACIIIGIGVLVYGIISPMLERKKAAKNAAQAN